MTGLRAWLARPGAVRMPSVDGVTASGLVLLLTSVVLWFGTLAPLRANVADLRDEVERLETANRDGTRGPRSLDAQARAFVRRLPARNDLPGVLAVVAEQARTAGLALERGDYEFALAKSGNVARYHLTLPVVGTYPQIRRFVSETLARLPPVALEGLALERDAVGDAQLRASLRFVVMVRGEP